MFILSCSKRAESDETVPDAHIKAEKFAQRYSLYYAIVTTYYFLTSDSISSLLLIGCLGEVLKTAFSFCFCYKHYHDTSQSHFRTSLSELVEVNVYFVKNDIWVISL